MINKLIILFSFFCLGCSNEPPTLFELNTESKFTISAGLDNFRTHTFIMRNIPTRINSVFSLNNENLISGIFASRARIEAPFVNFDFSLINTVIINIWDPRFPEDKKEVFFIDLFNNRNHKDLQLFSSLSEVKDILLNNTFDAEVRILFKAFTPTEVESILRMNFVAHGQR